MSQLKLQAESAKLLEDNLKTLIASVRNEFHVKKMPFLLFQVGFGNVVSGMQNVSKADQYVSLIPQSNNKNSKDYYPKNPPPVGHYVAASMKRIGENFFNYYVEAYASNYFK